MFQNQKISRQSLNVSVKNPSPPHQRPIGPPKSLSDSKFDGKLESGNDGLLSGIEKCSTQKTFWANNLPTDPSIPSRLITIFGEGMVWRSSITLNPSKSSNLINNNRYVLSSSSSLFPLITIIVIMNFLLLSLSVCTVNESYSLPTREEREKFIRGGAYIAVYGS